MVIAPGNSQLGCSNQTQEQIQSVREECNGLCLSMLGTKMFSGYFSNAITESSEENLEVGMEADSCISPLFSMMWEKNENAHLKAQQMELYQFPI